MIVVVKHQTCGVRGENTTPLGFGLIHTSVRPTLCSAHRLVCSATAATSTAAHPLAGGALLVGQAAELTNATVWNERRR